MVSVIMALSDRGVLALQILLGLVTDRGRRMEKWRPAAVLLPPWIPCERPALDAIKSLRANLMFTFSIISSLHRRQSSRTKDEEQQPYTRRNVAENLQQRLIFSSLVAVRWR
jgi:hypothetical protein